MLLYRSMLLVSVMSLLLAQRESVAQFASLASRVPTDANSLVLVDVEKINDSPAGIAGNWKTKLNGAYAAGVTLVPPGTHRAVFASQLDLEFMSPLWQTVIMQLDHAPNTAEIAKQTGGTVDEVGRFPAVRLPHDAYVIHFQEKVFGVMAPANRQVVGKWVLQVAKRTAPELSPYLMEAYHYANDVGTPIIMAIDLEHALSETEIKARLKDRWQEAGLAGKADPLAVAKVLTTMKGITLGVTLHEKPFGKIKIDFTEDASALSEIAKPLFLHVLDHRGLTIDEFADWKYAVKGKQVTLEGNLTSSGLRRIFSVFDRPPALSEGMHQASLGPTTSAPQTQEQKQAQATLAYFEQLQHLLKDLKGEKYNSTTYSAGSIAQWCENYARKIGSLPLLNVDPEMVALGNNTANALTQASLTLKGGAVKAGVDAMNVQNKYDTYTQNNIYGYTSRWGFYGGGVVPVGNTNSVTVIDESATQDERIKARSKAYSQSAMQAREILSGIDQGVAEVRAKMTQKYQIEFK